MNYRHYTIIGLVIAAFLVAVWDTFAAGEGGYPATITAVIRQASGDNPIIPLVAGILMGHLFWHS